MKRRGTLPEVKRVRLGLSVGTIAWASLTSRALGFVKFTLAIVAIGGTAATVGGQVFDVANALPTNLYGLIGGGVLGAVLVPQIVKALGEGQAGRDRIDKLLTLTLLSAAVLTVVLVFAAPVLVTAYASGWSPSWVALASAMAYWCLPQVFFYIVYALLSQILNAESQFGWPAWAPALSNVIAIAGLAIFIVFLPSGRAGVHSWTPWMIAWLCGTATLSIVIQGLVLVWPLRRAGFRFRPRLGVAGLGHASRIALWTFCGVAAGQVAFLVLSNVATAAGQSLHHLGINGPALNSYGYAFTLVFFPHGVATVALTTAMFTRLSQSAADRDFEAVNKNIVRTTGLVVFVCVGASLFLFVTGPLITNVIWGTPVIGDVVRPLSLGLLGLSMTFVVSRGLFALHNGRGPFMAQAVAAVVASAGEIAAGVFLPPQLVVIGAAAAVAVSNLLAWAVAHRMLRSAMRAVNAALTITPGRAFFLRLGVSGVAAALAGGAVLALTGGFEGDGRIHDLLVLVAATLAIGIVYVSLAFLLVSVGTRNELLGRK